MRDHRQTLGQPGKEIIEREALQLHRRAVGGKFSEHLKVCAFDATP